MAVAKRAVKKATGEDKGVILVLTNTEAEVIQRLLSNVAGSRNSPRKYADRISMALDTLDIPNDHQHYVIDRDTGGGTIFFKDYPAPVKAPKATAVDPINGPTTATQQFTGCGPSRKPAPAEVEKVNLELGEALALIPPSGPKVGDTIEFIRDYAFVPKGARMVLQSAATDYFTGSYKGSAVYVNPRPGDDYKLI